MITVRVPLRVTLSGGATDLEACYRNHTGYVISAAISKHLSIRIEPNKYGPGESQQVIPDAYALAAGWTRHDNVITSSDVPLGSGLGGSGALMVGLIKAKYPTLSKYELMHAAHWAERVTLGQQCGIQDHAIAAYGGVIGIVIEKEGIVSVGKGVIPKGFQERLAMFHTGVQRSAGQILASQQDAVHANVDANSAILKIRQLGEQMAVDLLEGGKEYGRLTREHWECKKTTCSAISSPQIDEWYDLALNNGAEGGKLIGAGGGGYMLFVCKPDSRDHLISAMVEAGMKHTPFEFVNHGAIIQ